MKINKLKDLYSKIDIDASMDQRIREHLLYDGARYKETNIQKIRHLKREERSCGFSGSRVNLSRVLTKAALSVSALIIVAVLLYAFKEAFVQINDIWRKAVTSEGLEEPNRDESVMPEDDGPNEGNEQALFHSAFFEVISNKSMKVSIPGLVIRLKGKANAINPADLTDVIFTRDGVHVNNGLMYTGTYKSLRVDNEDVTDFYFAFEYDNVEPGRYGLTGKYQGEPFEVMEKIIEKTVSGEPAEAGALRIVELWHFTDADLSIKKITELSFLFEGHQNAFYPADLTDLKCFRDGEEIKIAFLDEVFRYYESDGMGSANTSYNLIFSNPLTESGRYKITGRYRGVYFETNEVMLP